jgi:hypothetical protein
MKWLFFFIFSFFQIQNEKNYLSEILISRENEAVLQLSQLTKPGDILVFESQNVCSGCAQTLATMLNRLQNPLNLYLLVNETSAKDIRFRTNSWNNYLRYEIKGVGYDSISLPNKIPSPVVILRKHSGFKMYDYDDFILKNGKINKSGYRDLKKQIRKKS